MHVKLSRRDPCSSESNAKHGVTTVFAIAPSPRLCSCHRSSCDPGEMKASISTGAALFSKMPLTSRSPKASRIKPVGQILGDSNLIQGKCRKYRRGLSPREKKEGLRRFRRAKPRKTRKLWRMRTRKRRKYG